MAHDFIYLFYNLKQKQLINNYQKIEKNILIVMLQLLS